MEVGEPTQRNTVWGELEALLNDGGVVEQVLVGDDHAFGVTGRARGILQKGDGFRGNVGRDILRGWG